MGKIVYLESYEEYAARTQVGNTIKVDKSYLTCLVPFVLGLILLLTVKFYETRKEQQGAVSTQTQITNTATNRSTK